MSALPLGRAALGGLILAAAVLWTTEAAGYCRTSVCAGGFAGQLCNPPDPADCGKALYWAKPCFGVAVQQDASRQVDFDTTSTLVMQAFAAWENVDCSGQAPAISVSSFGAVSCDQQEYNQSGGNANIVVFRDDEWPYAGQGRTLALTTVTYNLDNGEIFDADLEINSSNSIKLTVGDANVQYDLLSIITHEAGHMLGLAHTPETQATMTIEYLPGDTFLRDLHPDDIAGICDAFPPPKPATCDPEPRHGFKGTCGPAPPEEGCECRAGPAPQGGGWWLALAVFAAATARRRFSTLCE